MHVSVPSEIRARIAADVKRYVDIASKHFNRTYRVPEIHYDVRGRAAGYAEGAKSVRFNPVLLMENLQDFITRTVPHEVAHCIDSANGDNKRDSGEMLDAIMRARVSGRRLRRPKRSIHGPSWQLIMRVFGIDDITRCHEYDVTNAAVKTKRKFEYKCGTCTKSLFVSSVVHNRIAAGREYWCRKCGRHHGKLHYVQHLGQRTFEEAEKASLTRKASWEQVIQKLSGAAPAQAPIPSVAQNLGSQMDRARDCYRTYRGVSRGEMIDIFVRRLGMKASTASTYYNTLKDES